MENGSGKSRYFINEKTRLVKNYRVFSQIQPQTKNYLSRVIFMVLEKSPDLTV